MEGNSVITKKMHVFRSAAWVRHVHLLVIFFFGIVLWIFCLLEKRMATLLVNATCKIIMKAKFVL